MSDTFLSAVRYISKDRDWSVGVMECWSVRLGECTAEALRARSKEFLTKRFSELCELWASVVNNSSKETRNNPER
jgi:hypothetical protein